MFEVELSELKRLADIISTVSGNGFNYDWEFSVASSSRNGVYLRGYNAYDVMNEVGMYERTLPFCIKVFPDDNSFKVLFKSTDAYYVRKYDLREYFDYIFADVLN